MKRFFTAMTGGLIGAAAGWMGGDSVSPSPSQAVGRSSLPAEKASAAVSTSQVSLLDGPAVKARVEAAIASLSSDRFELRLLMARWLQTDAEAAKTWMRSLSDEQSRWYEGSSEPLKAFFAAWGAVDPEAAMAEALTLTEAKQQTLFMALLPALAKAEPALLASLLAKIPEGKTASAAMGGLKSLMTQLAAQELSSAQSLLSQLPKHLAENAAAGVAIAWSRTDPKAAYTWAQTLAVDLQKQVKGAILTEWARKDPHAIGPMLTEKIDGKGDVFHADAAMEALKSLSHSNPQDLADFTKKYLTPEQLKSNLGSLCFSFLGDHPNSGQAMSALTTCLSTLPSEELSETSLFKNGWPSMQTLKPAWDSVLAMPDSPTRTYLIEQLGNKVAGERPAEVIQQVMKEPDEKKREENLKAILGNQSGFGPFAGVSWLKDMQELTQAVESMPESVRSLGATKLVWATASVDPKQAAELIRRYPEVAHQENLILNLGIRYQGESTLAESQAWADSLPSDASKRSAYNGIFVDLVGKDLTEASRVAGELPLGPARDGAALAIAIHTQRKAPTEAFAWAVSIQDAESQAKASKLVFQSWSKRDPEAALATLEQSTLPPERQMELKKLIPTP